MNKHDLKTFWENEQSKAFQGWDFTYLNGRWKEEPLSWDYKQIVQSYLRPTDNLLDMGTGGGEFLLTLNHPYPLTSVTEFYPPNVQLCIEKLSPLGIDVKQILNDTEIPFETDKFDIVINRHESFDIQEVNRVLKSGGYFITQQVGGEDNNSLATRLIKDYIPQFPDHNLQSNIKKLHNNGFEILFASEFFPNLKFFDIGALVYFAKIIVWEFPDFSVEKCFDILCELDIEFQKKGYVNSRQHYFMIAARKK